MKHLKTFENFRFVESNEYPSAEEMKAHLCDCGYTPEECDEMSYEEICSCWEECNMMNFESKKNKPDFLDLDKDGDKKESMKKAAKEAKEKTSKKGSASGLSAAQKKLPAGLQKAILKKKK
jgi:signal recognition particle subunit SEC65